MERIATFFRWVWRLTAAASILFTLFFFLALFALLSGAVSLHRQAKSAAAVPESCVLVLAPGGSILEKRPPFNPADELSGLLNRSPQRKELFLQDIISGLRKAAKDSRIKLLLIVPDRLERAGLNQLREIGQAVAQFRASGKRVLAVADTYSQGQYYLAAGSDEIYLHPMGSVDIEGFGLFNLYLRELLDRLEVTFHIFRVGEFKSAVEPFLRKDMSPEAKENARHWLGRLWDGYCRDIAAWRKIPLQSVSDAADRLAENMEAAGGDAALMARRGKLIDGVTSAEELNERLRRVVGKGADEEDGYSRIDFSDYLDAVGGSYSKKLAEKDRIAILTAQGDIVYGEGGEGQIGSGGLVRQLRKLRLDKHVRAVVLRIDSGGGSAFASELIRQELLLTRKAGKPVVVSMGSVAASGAYWIATAADRIYASPYTITGSIGIFGAIPTIEKSLAKAGIFSDGIGTAGITGAGSLVRPLPENFRKAMQAQIELGYRRFIEIVAEGRKMNPADVEKIAGGRVWDGATAFELGLADQLGGLEEAVAAAAQLSGLPAEQASYVEEEQSPAEILLHSLRMVWHSTPDSLAARTRTILRRLAGQYSFLMQQNDPQHIYGHCLLPELL